MLQVLYLSSTAHDNKWLVYGASTGCHSHYECPYDIFVHELGKVNDRTRITSDNAFDNWPHLWVGDIPSPGTDPAFALSHTSLEFSVITGGQNPSDKEVTVTSINGLSLADLQATESAGWLQVALSGTGDTRKLTNKVTLGSMGKGEYTTDVTVQAGSINKKYTVTLYIIEPNDFHIEMNAGGNTVSGWESDDKYVNGGVDYSSTDNFDLNKATNPRPVALYQTSSHVGPSSGHGAGPTSI